MIAINVARIIANITVFFETVDEDVVDIDTCCEQTEWLCAEVQAMDKPFLRELIDAFAVVAPEFGKSEQLVRDIPFGFYLEEELAADDPVRLAELDAIREARG